VVSGQWSEADAGDEGVYAAGVCKCSKPADFSAYSQGSTCAKLQANLDEFGPLYHLPTDSF